MTRRPIDHPKRRAAASRGMVQALAAAMVLRDRARAGVERAEAGIARDRSAGLDVAAHVARLGELKAVLAERDIEIDRVRQAFGMTRKAKAAA